MDLRQFLQLLKQQDNITIQFSHLGYIVKRGTTVLDTRGNHMPVKPVTRTERVRKVGNMYCAIASACRYMSDDMRLMVGDLLACMASEGERR